MRADWATEAVRHAEDGALAPGVMDGAGRIVVGPASAELRRELRPIEWMVLEDVALEARRAGAGELVAATSARRAAERLGLTPGAVARALARLRAAGLVTHARQAGLAGRFGLSAYVLGAIRGLDVLDATDRASAPPCAVPPCPARPHIDGPRAVDAHMAGTTEPSGPAGADVSPAPPHGDVGAAPAGAVDDLATEERTRSAAGGQRSKRGRRPSSKPSVGQLCLLDSALDDPAHRR